MASTSSSHRQNALSGIEPQNERREIEKSSRLFDVFINHRGPDVKETLATQLYHSLKELGISAFLDSEEKELGNSFTSIIEAAVSSASVHIAIFSQRYAGSAWCLAELVLMLQTNAKIIPVFYQVKPSELRYIETGVYAKAFHQYVKKGRYLDKLKDWKEALQKVSYTAGVELSPDSNDINDIVSAVEKEVQRTRRLHVAKYPVGLDKLVNDFERRCLHKLVQDYESLYGMKKAAKERANVVGIFGMGGVGKTTLSLELFNQKRSNYTKVSFLPDVREAYARGTLPLLQSKLLEEIFCEKNRSFPSNNEGTSYLSHCFERSSTLSFLIVLDDIDHVEQLDALLPIDVLNTHGNANHLVIITTRDVGVLVGAEIDIAYHLRGLDREDGRELFCWHAFKQSLPVCGYEDLVEAFVNVCGGLPLSLKVLGGHVFRRERWYWQDELEKVKETLPTDIKHRLKISIDRLNDVEKQIFIDIACFFIGKSVTKAMLIWNGSGWRARRALETLKERCLIEEVKEELQSMWESTPVGYPVGEHDPFALLKLKFYLESTPEGYAFRMHDHLRDLGREMADKLSNPHRVWRVQDLKSLESNGFQNILTQKKSRTFHSTVDESIGCKITYFLGKPKDGSDASLLWLQLEYSRDPNLDINSHIPSWVPLENLQCLRISNGSFQKLWQSDVKAPSHLEEFQIRDTSVKEFPDLLGKLSNMKKLVLDATDIETDIWSVLKSPKMNFRSFRMMPYKLEGHLAYDDAAEETALMSLVIYDLGQPLERKVDLNDEGRCRTVMSGLENLEIRHCDELEMLGLAHLSCLKSISIEYCKKIKHIILPTSLIKLDVRKCTVLQGIAGIADLIKLTHLCIAECPALQELPLSSLNCLEEIKIRSYEKLQNITLPTTLSKLDIYGCTVLQGIAGIADLIKLTHLCIGDCPKLQELPLSGLNCLEEILIKSCEKLQNITLPTTLSKLDIYGCTVLQGIAGIADLIKLIWLCIVDCPELQELPLSSLNCLEEIEIRSCEKLQNITLPTTLSKLDIYTCTVLQGIAGIADLIKLTHLCIVDCPKLQELPLSRLNCLMLIEIYSCEKLQNITLPTTLTKLTDLCIADCPALELLCLGRLICLKRFDIDSCENLEIISRIEEFHVPNYTRLRYCGYAVTRYFIDRLKSLPWCTCLIGKAVDGAESSLNENLFSDANFAVDDKNLENISTVEELHVPEYARLRYCGYAATRYFIDRLKILPRHTCLIGKAVDGAESSLKELLLSEANIAVDGVTEISTDNYYPDWSGLGVVILCFVVVIDSSTSAEEINDDYDLKMRQGESPVTVVESSEYSEDVTVVESSEYREDVTVVESSEYSEDVTVVESSEYSEDFTVVESSEYSEDETWLQGESLVTVVESSEYSEDETWKLLEHYSRKMKKGFRVDLREGEEWKSLPVLRTIVDRLYDKE